MFYIFNVWSICCLELEVVIYLIINLIINDVVNMCGRNEKDVDKCDGKEVKIIIDDII